MRTDAQTQEGDRKGAVRQRPGGLGEQLGWAAEGTPAACPGGILQALSSPPCPKLTPFSRVPNSTPRRSPTPSKFCKADYLKPWFPPCPIIPSPSQQLGAGQGLFLAWAVS